MSIICEFLDWLSGESEGKEVDDDSEPQGEEKYYIGDWEVTRNPPAGNYD